VSIAPHIRHATPNYCIATWDRVLLQIWRREVTPDAIESLSSIGRAFVATSAGPTCSLALIESTSPPPTDKLRGALSAFYREMAPHMREQIIVAEGSGFRAALVRSVGLALSAIAPSSLPFRFVGGIDEAAALIRPHLTAGAGGVNGLNVAIKDLRGKLP
jgi:hypothetical protein